MKIEKFNVLLKFQQLRWTTPKCNRTIAYNNSDTQKNSGNYRVKQYQSVNA